MNEKTVILTSPDFEPFGRIPDQNTCEGADLNPRLEIASIPPGTKSLALIVDDVDAITPEGPWVHWLIWNLQNLTTIEENSAPSGAVQGTNSSGRIGWRGPCPPPVQPHHYRFTIYALDSLIDLPQGSSKFDLQKAMDNKILGTGELVGEYSRPGLG